MKLRLLLVFYLTAVHCSAQITFSVETVKKQDTLLPLKPLDSIYQWMYEPNLLINKAIQHEAFIKKPLRIYVSSNGNERQVFFGTHPFFNGMFEAYKTHRPIVLSPDIIWLLISQGFSHHVNFNAAPLRHFFVSFSGKKELSITSRTLTLSSPSKEWEGIFPTFIAQMVAYTGNDIVNILTSNFSTTNTSSRLASQISIMDAMKQYFQYKVILIGCGLPQVTLEGTTADWELILKKANRLRKYDLDWWIDRLTPILQEFIASSRGNVNKTFWTNFIKKHEEKGAYGVAIGVDGSFLSFYPYDKDGHKLNGRFLWNASSLPDEIAKVPLKYEVQDEAGHVTDTRNLVIWSGFTGCSQNPKTCALRPEMGWMIAEAGE